MANGGLFNISDISDIPVGFISNLGQLALWLQGIGLILLFWIIFQLISFYLNRKRIKEIYNIKKDIVRIEGKIDKLLDRKNNRLR